MGDCGVCLSGFDGTSEFCHKNNRRSRKLRWCIECQKKIQKGEIYEASSGKTDGDLWSFTTCLVCAEIAEAFYCNGRIFGGLLWEEMEECGFENMNTGCLNRLGTTEAKSELIRRWNKWKFR